MLDEIQRAAEKAVKPESVVEFIKKYRAKIVEGEIENHATCRTLATLSEADTAWGDEWNPNPLTRW